MNILIVGFQRSGTTLLRRLLELHPEVKRMLHEVFLLKRYDNKHSLLTYIKNLGIDTNKDNWGEKVPYFPSARKVPILRYCEKWNEYFQQQSKILHIVRHPFDVALSNEKKFKHITSVDTPIKIYKSIVPVVLEKTSHMLQMFTFKYEDLLLDSEKILFEVYKHCGLTPNIDFKSLMERIENKKYQKFDKERAFAYKKQKLVSSYDLKDTMEKLNKIPGSKYEI